MGLWERLHGPDLLQVWCFCCLFLLLTWRGMACPASCVCNSTMITCMKQNMGIVAFPVLGSTAQAETITDIYIAYQRNFATINNSDVKIYTGLKSLTVTDSGLKVISRQAFQNNLKLTYINLSRNKLPVLSRKLFRHLSLSQLIVYGNPFLCSCDIMWIKVLQETNTLSTENQNMYCINENDKRIALHSMQVSNCGFPTVNVSTTNLTVLEGNDATLYCDATGLPDPNISWDVSQINSTIIVQADTSRHPSFLKLKNVTSMDNKKIIVCIAENNVGENEVIVELNVHFAPKITFIDVPTLDHHWCIPFSVRGNPRPTFLWFHEGAILSETDFIWNKVHETSDNLSEHHGCLQLDSPTHFNNGLYTLRAENEYGKDERTIMAHFMTIPDDGNETITEPAFYDYETTSNDNIRTSTDNGVTSTDVSNDGSEDSVTVYVVVGIAALVCTCLVIMLIILKFGRHSKFGLKGFVLFHSVPLDV